MKQKWRCEGCGAIGEVPEDFDYLDGTLHFCGQVKGPYDIVPTLHIFEEES